MASFMSYHAGFSKAEGLGTQSQDHEHTGGPSSQGPRNSQDESDGASPAPSGQEHRDESGGHASDGEAADAAGPSAPLPPTGSYYTYAGQRVLVPEWPLIKLRNNKAMSRNLSVLLRQVWTEDAPPGIPELGRKWGKTGLSEWGKEMLLRIKAKVSALETSEPTRYREVS